MYNSEQLHGLHLGYVIDDKLAPVHTGLLEAPTSRLIVVLLTANMLHLR